MVNYWEKKKANYNEYSSRFWIWIHLTGIGKDIYIFMHQIMWNKCILHSFTKLYIHRTSMILVHFELRSTEKCRDA
jgi:hypothetical protein